jgi:hypothetical protein
MIVEPASKVFLQNKLSRCRTTLHEMEPLLQAKSKQNSFRNLTGFDNEFSDRDMEKLSERLDAYAGDPSLGDVDEILDVCRIYSMIQVTEHNQTFIRRIIWIPSSN